MLHTSFNQASQPNELSIQLDSLNLDVESKLVRDLGEILNLREKYIKTNKNPKKSQIPEKLKTCDEMQGDVSRC